METNKLTLKTNTLEECLQKTQHILERARQAHYFLFPADIRSSSSKALVRVNENIENLLHALSDTQTAELTKVGLAPRSADLNFKLAIFDKVASQFHVTGGFKAFGHLLDIIITLLGSLAEIFKIADAALETLSMIRKIIELKAENS